MKRLDASPTNESQNPKEQVDLGQGTPKETKAFEALKVEERIRRKKNSPLSGILAHCHQCLGYYHDGREDCENTTCPLYTWMPFRQLKPDYDWCRYNPKRIGKQLETYNAEAAERAKANLQRKPQ